jgi:hypothetical protein
LLLAFLAVGYNLYQIATVKLATRPAGQTGTGAAPPKRPASNWDDEDERAEDDDWPVRRKPGD